MGVCGEGKKATTEHANDVVGEEAILLGGFCDLLSTSTGTNLVSLHVPTRYIQAVGLCFQSSGGRTISHMEPDICC